MTIELNPVWKQQCVYYHGLVLCGKFTHWCRSCDMLPIDETVKLWSQCNCFTKKEIEQGFPDPLEPPTDYKYNDKS